MVVEFGHNNALMPHQFRRDFQVIARVYSFRAEHVTEAVVADPLFDWWISPFAITLQGFVQTAACTVGFTKTIDE